MKTECFVTFYDQLENPTYNATWKALLIGAIISKVEFDWFEQIEKRRQKKIEECRLK